MIANKRLTARVAAFAAALMCVACVLAPASALAEAAQNSTDVAVSGTAANGSALYNPNAAPENGCTAGILVDLDEDVVLYTKEADEQRYPASTTKIMTALLVLENGSLDDVVTIEADDFAQLGEDSMMSGLIAGEQYTVRDLLACMLLPSGNDAAYALARYVGGTWQDFVTMMNARAAELGCTGTHFANPCGLHDDNHYTTARDLLRIFEEALRHEDFVTIAGSATWELGATDKQAARMLESTDFLVESSSDAYMDGQVVAGKTGYTLEGGKCLVAAAERDGRRVAAVLLGGANDAEYGEVTSNFYDMKNLLTWGLDAWGYVDVVSPGDVLGKVAVRFSDDGKNVAAASTGTVTAFVPTGLTLADLTVDEEMPDSVDAAVDEGAPLGEASVSYEGRYLGTVSVAAAEARSFSPLLFVMDWLQEPTHVAIVVAALILLALVVTLIATRGERKRNRDRKKAQVGTDFSDARFDDEPDEAEKPKAAAKPASKPAKAKHFKS